MATDIIVSTIGKATVVEFQVASLMDPVMLESLAVRLVALVDEQDRRILILDFARVQYLSSQAIGVVITLHRKLGALPNSKFLLCGINPKLAELLKLTRLDKVLTIKPSQKEAINSVTL